MGMRIGALGAIVVLTGLTVPVMAQDATERGAERTRATQREDAAREQAERTVRQIDPEARRAAAERARAARANVAQPAEADPAWKAQLPVGDQALMDSLVGHAPPRFPDYLTWYNTPTGGEAPSWLQFRDRIVVVQSWTSANSAGRDAMKQAVEAVSDFPSSDVTLLLVHTPEGAENAGEHIAEAGSADNVIHMVDSRGEWCDEAGIFRTPVNFIVNRNGAVAFAGLTNEGVKSAVESILDDPYEENLAVAPLPSRDRRLTPRFPAARGNTGSTPNIQGKVGPDVYVSEWVTSPPSSLDGKVIMVEFWRTNCPHCVNAIPKLNELAAKYADDVAIVAITHEARSALDQGLSRRNLSANSFQYPVGIDTDRRTSNAVGVRGVPHALVMSSDGIVRYQGHPASLTDELLEQIIQANKVMLAAADDKSRRWATE